MEPFEDILSRAEETLRGWFCKKDSRSTLEAFDRRAVVWTGMDEEASAHGYAQLERLFSSNRDKYARAPCRACTWRSAAAERDFVW